MISSVDILNSEDIRRNYRPFVVKMIVDSEE